MGLFTYPITLIGPAGEEIVDATVDAAASFSMAPSSLLQRLGLQPITTRRFELGDGRIVDYAVEAFLLAVDTQNKRLVPTHAWLL